MALFFAAMIPLFVIALYNYPADDDFAFIYPITSTWVSTGSLGAVFQTIIRQLVNLYLTWNGYITGFLFTYFSPFIFGLQYYFLSTWFILVFICLSVGYMIKSLTVHVFHAPKPVFYIVFTVVVLMGIEYTPAISEAVYWNPGASYIFNQCFIWLSLGLLMMCNQPQRRP